MVESSAVLDDRVDTTSTSTGIAKVVEQDGMNGDNPISPRVEAPITNLVNFSIMVPNGYALPDGTVERYIPKQLHGPIERAAEFLHYISEHVVELFARSYDYSKRSVHNIAESATGNVDLFFSRLNNFRTLRDAQRRLKKIGAYLTPEGEIFKKTSKGKIKVGSYWKTESGWYAAGIDYDYIKAKYALEKAGFPSVGINPQK